MVEIHLDGASAFEGQHQLRCFLLVMGAEEVEDAGVVEELLVVGVEGAEVVEE